MIISLLNPRYCTGLALLFVFIMIMHGTAFASDASKKIPENATAKRYGSGWECNAGFRESGGACAAIKIPANASANGQSYGKGWECNRGSN